MKIDKIYIVHYEPLVERKKYLDDILPILTKLTNNYEYIISSKESDYEISKNIDRYYIFNSKHTTKPLSINEISVSISHLKIYEDIVKNNYNICLILEDDTTLTNNFVEKLTEVLKENLEELDFIFLSTCCDIVVNKQNDNYIQPFNYSKCVSGYLVTNKKLKKVLEQSKPFSTNIDNHLNIIRETIGLKFGVCEPPILIQGSETKYKSNLR
jgi:glycosyl transferase family 25